MVSSTVFSSTWQGTLAKEKVQQAEVWGFFTQKNVNFIILQRLQYLTITTLQHLVGLFFLKLLSEESQEQPKKENDVTLFIWLQEGLWRNFKLLQRPNQQDSKRKQINVPTKVTTAQDFADPAMHYPLTNAHHHSIWSWKSSIKLEDRKGKGTPFPSTRQTGCFHYKDTLNLNSHAPWNRAEKTHIHVTAATSSSPSVRSPSRH